MINRDGEFINNIINKLFQEMKNQLEHVRKDEHKYKHNKYIKLNNHKVHKI